MECKEVCEKMGDYIEQQLSQEEIKQFEEHMKDCKDCQAKYEKLEKLMIKLKNVKEVTPRKSLKEDIMQNIKNMEAKKKKAKIIHFRRYMYLASGFLFFIVGAYAINNLSVSPMEIEAEKEGIEVYSKGIATDIEPKAKVRSLEESFFYEKDITEDMKTKVFNYDMVMYKDDNYSIYFENRSKDEVYLSIEDIDGNIIGETLLIEGKATGELNFKSEQEEQEKIYSVKLQSKDKNLYGYLKIEKK